MTDQERIAELQFLFNELKEVAIYGCDSEGVEDFESAELQVHELLEKIESAVDEWYSRYGDR